ncbi:MAG TPA: ISAzo13 family transposase [Candidatus Dormibacteraeota bacterium]|nr:ISAzo13 family transposase [Candidatus Dormibacteraeota bacterium]
MPALESNVIQVLADYTAGDPSDAEVLWTFLTPAEISEELAMAGTPVATDTVRTILDDFGFVQRKAQKYLAMGASPDRDAQFNRIATHKAEYEASGNPILSMDAKKKEYLGNYFRPGRLYTTGVLRTLDHDFHSPDDPVVVQHGLFDIQRNLGHITLGSSHETSEFACHCLIRYWRQYGQLAYPEATSILLLCDGGGSNSSRHYIFKEDLQRAVNRIGIPIRVAHYPPYCSKYNPIEHNFFPHVTRACQGVIFHTLDIVKAFIRRTWTSAGLRATVNVIDKVYELKRKASDAFMQTMPIVFDKKLPQWNYTVVLTIY